MNRNVLMGSVAVAAVATASSQAHAWWFVCDFIDAFNSVRTASKTRAAAYQSIIDNEPVDVSSRKYRAAQRQTLGAYSKAVIAGTKVPGTTLKPAPTSFGGLAKPAVEEGVKEIIQRNLLNKGAFNTPTSGATPADFAPTAEPFGASLASQSIGVGGAGAGVSFTSFATFTSTDAPPEAGTPDPGFEAENVGTIVYLSGEFSGFTFDPVTGYQADGSTFVYDAGDLAADLALDPDLGIIAMDGSALTQAEFDDIGGVLPGADEISLFRVTEVNTLTGELAGEFLVIASVPSPGGAALLGLAGLVAARRRRA